MNVALCSITERMIHFSRSAETHNIETWCADLNCRSTKRLMSRPTAHFGMTCFWYGTSLASSFACAFVRNVCWFVHPHHSLDLIGVQVCEHELASQRRQDILRSTTATAAERRAVETGVNAAVESQIAKVFKGKTRVQLTELEDSVRDKLASGNPGDVTYWEYMLIVRSSLVVRLFGWKLA